MNNINRILLKKIFIFLILIGLIAVIDAKSNVQEKIIKKESDKKMRVMPKVFLGKMSLDEAILKRRSVREFSSQNISDSAISAILFSAQGITDSINEFRAVPSAGATFPLELYLISSYGVERYLPKKHALEKISNQDKRKELMEACLYQDFVAIAPASVIITGVFERTTKRYGERGIRYVYMEAGHTAQNINLQAVALGLGSVCVGAFEDEKVEKIIGCKKDEKAIYIICIGKTKK